MKIAPSTAQHSADLLTNLTRPGAGDALRKPKVRGHTQNVRDPFGQALKHAERRTPPAPTANEANESTASSEISPETLQQPANESEHAQSPRIDPIVDPSIEPSTSTPSASAKSDSEQAEAPIDESSMPVAQPIIPLDKQIIQTEKHIEQATDAASDEMQSLQHFTQAKSPQSSARVQQETPRPADDPAESDAIDEQAADAQWVEQLTTKALNTAKSLIRTVGYEKSSALAAAARSTMSDTSKPQDSQPQQPAPIAGQSAPPAPIEAAPPSVSAPVAPTNTTLPTKAEQRDTKANTKPSPDIDRTSTAVTPLNQLNTTEQPTPHTLTTLTPAQPTLRIELGQRVKVETKPNLSKPTADLAEQAAHGLSVALRDLPAPAGQRSVSMNLNPQSMGQLRIELHVAGDAVAVQFHVGSAKAKSSLSKSLDDFKSSIEKQGLRLQSITINEDRALAAPPHPSADQTPQNPLNPDASGNPGQHHHAGNPFADAPRSIPRADAQVLPDLGDGVAREITGVGGGAIEIITYRLDAVA